MPQPTINYRARASIESRAHAHERAVAVAFTPSLVSDDMATLKAAACAGLGVVALPAYVGHAEVERGQLVRVLPEWIAGLATMSVLMPSRRGLMPSVGAFVEYLAEHVPAVVR